MNRNVMAVVAALWTLPFLGAGSAADEGGAPAAILDLDGVFVERDPVILAYRPEVKVGPARIIEAAAPGPVEAGQVLVRLHSEALEQKVQDVELDLVSLRLRLNRQREEARRAGELLALELVEQDLKVADAERKLEEKSTISQPQQLMSSKDRVDNLDVSLADREEEFRLRVKVYEADKLLETNERMDLESTRRRLDRSRLTSPNVIARHEILKNITLPREIAVLVFGLRRARHERDLFRATSKTRTESRRLELAKQELALQRQRQTLEKLLRDREALTMTAPVDGTAIAGRYRGAWTNVEATAQSLRPGARVNPDQVLYTIVQPAPKLVRTSIPEAKLFEVREGQAATLVPNAVKVSLPAVVISVSPFSVEGQFEVWLKARTRHERLFPGNTCKVQIAAGQD